MVRAGRGRLLNSEIIAGWRVVPRDLGCSSSLSRASGEQRSTLGPAQARREERVVSGSQRSLMGARLTTHAEAVEAVAGCPRPSALPYQMGSEDDDFAFTWTTRFNELGMKRLRVPYPTLLLCLPLRGAIQGPS